MKAARATRSCSACAQNAATVASKRRVGSCRSAMTSSEGPAVTPRTSRCQTRARRPRTTSSSTRADTSTKALPICGAIHDDAHVSAIRSSQPGRPEACARRHPRAKQTIPPALRCAVLPRGSTVAKCPACNNTSAGRASHRAPFRRRAPRLRPHSISRCISSGNVMGALPSLTSPCTLKLLSWPSPSRSPWAVAL